MDEREAIVRWLATAEVTDPPWSQRVKLAWLALKSPGLLMSAHWWAAAEYIERGEHIKEAKDGHD